jgi:hypothetical protein
LDGREYALFAAGVGLAILHVLDDTFVGRQPGTSIGDELFSGVVVGGILVAALVLYPRLPAGWRALLAFSLGVLIATAGAMHLAHVAIDEAERSDFTGILALAGGLLLIGLSALVAWRSRRGGTLRRRVGRRALVGVGVLALSFFVLFPIGVAIYVTRTPREPIDGTFSVAHEDVVFETKDGLTIRAGTHRLGTARPSSSSTVPGVTARDRGSRPACSPAMATASCSTTPVVRARATETRWATTGPGNPTSTRRSNFSRRGRTSETAGSAGSGSRPAPTR